MLMTLLELKPKVGDRVVYDYFGFHIIAKIESGVYYGTRSNGTFLELNKLKGWYFANPI
jgi:RNA polymerase-interacting CarD/CdnL/TRCF family regulator